MLFFCENRENIRNDRDNTVPYKIVKLKIGGPMSVFT